MRAALLAPIAAFAFAFTGGLYLATDHATAQDGPGDVTARAGDGTEGYSVDLFLPADITIETGSTVTWEFPWLEPHSVTYGTPAGDPSVPSHPDENPLVFDDETYFSSGLLTATDEGVPTFSVTFAESGEYEIYCILHPMMISTITVVDDAELADSQDEIDARGAEEYQDALDSLILAAEELRDAPVVVEDRVDGSKRYTVQIGEENESGVAMQFFPDELEIEEGDSINFVNEGFVPHTASFGPYPGGDPFALPVSDNSEPWDGTGFYHSGVLGQEWPGGTSFEVTFANAGTYDFYCALHANQGQVGSVTVVEGDDDETPTAEPTTPAPTSTPTEQPTTAPTATPTKRAPAPPNTGTGNSNGMDAGTAAAWALGGMALLAMGAGSIAVARTRR